MKYFIENGDMITGSIIVIILVFILYSLFFGLKNMMVKGPCQRFGKKYALSSCMVWAMAYYFSLIATLSEIYLYFGKNSLDAAEWIAQKVEVPGIVFFFFVGLLFSYMKVGFFLVNGNVMYLMKCGKIKKISLDELKKYAKEQAPVINNKKVIFYYQDMNIIIPVTNCNGGYDFVNKLCDDMNIHRVKMR